MCMCMCMHMLCCMLCCICAACVRACVLGRRQGGARAALGLRWGGAFSARLAPTSRHFGCRRTKRCVASVWPETYGPSKSPCGCWPNAMPTPPPWPEWPWRCSVVPVMLAARCAARCVALGGGGGGGGKLNQPNQPKGGERALPTGRHAGQSESRTTRCLVIKRDTSLYFEIRLQ